MGNLYADVFIDSAALCCISLHVDAHKHIDEQLCSTINPDGSWIYCSFDWAFPKNSVKDRSPCLTPSSFLSHRFHLLNINLFPFILFRLYQTFAVSLQWWRTLLCHHSVISSRRQRINCSIVMSLSNTFSFTFNWHFYTEGVTIKAANRHQIVSPALSVLAFYTEDISRLPTMANVTIALIIHDYMISNAFCSLNTVDCVCMQLMLSLAQCKIFRRTSPSWLQDPGTRYCSRYYSKENDQWWPPCRIWIIFALLPLVWANPEVLSLSVLDSSVAP